MAKMLHKRPTNSEELVVKWTEFLAEFKTLPNLDPVSKEMNFIQLHSLDTLGLIGAVLSLVLFMIYKLLSCICGLCCGKKVEKKGKS
jgi:glucuronosyltransferase